MPVLLRAWPKRARGPKSLDPFRTGPDCEICETWAVVIGLALVGLSVLYGAAEGDHWRSWDETKIMD